MTRSLKTMLLSLSVLVAATAGNAATIPVRPSFAELSPAIAKSRAGNMNSPGPCPTRPTLVSLPVVKSMASVPGRFYVLTDYSLEVWSSAAPVLMPRRRAVR